MLRAIIFDFDGVLVDTEKLHYQAFNRIFEQFNFQVTTQEYYDRFLGLSDKELLQVVARERNLPIAGKEFKQLLTEKARIFKKLAETLAPVIAGVPQLLKMLADNKISMAICSGALLSEIKMILKGAGLLAYFDAIVSAEQVKKGKPNPEGFLLALKLLNKKSLPTIQPQDCVVIEDSHWGLEAARNGGMHPVAITNSYPADQLKPAEKIIANLGELTLDCLQILCR